jgi:hypothetical protein
VAIGDARGRAGEDMARQRAPCGASCGKTAARPTSDRLHQHHSTFAGEGQRRPPRAAFGPHLARTSFFLRFLSRSAFSRALLRRQRGIWHFPAPPLKVCLYSLRALHVTRRSFRALADSHNPGGAPLPVRDGGLSPQSLEQKSRSRFTRCAGCWFVCYSLVLMVGRGRIWTNYP